MVRMKNAKKEGLKDKAKTCCRLLIKQAGRQTHDRQTLHVGQKMKV